GEVWEMSAPCWSSDVRISRISSAGVEQLRTPMSGWLAGFEGGQAIGSDGTAPALISPSLAVTKIPVPAGQQMAWWPGGPLALDGEVTFATTGWTATWVARWQADAGAPR